MSLKHEGWKSNNQIHFMQFLINCNSSFPDYVYKPREKLRFVKWSSLYGPKYFSILVLSTLCSIEMYSSNFKNFLDALADYFSIWIQRGWPKNAVNWYNLVFEKETPVNNGELATTYPGIVEDPQPET